MARFVALPDILIVKIFKLLYFSPSDIDSYCLISKHIRAVARPFLERHMRFKRRFTNWRNTDEPGFEFYGPLAKLLKDILDVPRAAMYVTSLHVNELRGTKAQFKKDEAMLRSFSKFVQNCAVIPEDQKRQWIDHLEAGNEDPVIGILLLTLPNLIRLRLTTDDSFLTKCMMKLISISEPPMALVHLRTVELKSSYFQFPHTNLFKCFSLLPSIERLSVFDSPLAPIYLEPELRAMVQTRKSPIRHLHFKNVQLNPTLLSEVLATSECLATFAYYGSDKNPGSDPEPKQFRDALLATAKETLEHLTLRDLDMKSVLVSLRGFKVLETVDLSVELLLDFDLAQLLPRNTKTLNLYDKSLDLKSFQAVLFHGFRGDRETFTSTTYEAVPYLERINYTFKNVVSESTSIYDYEAAKKRLRNCGIQLVLSWHRFQFSPWMHRE